MRPVKLSAKFIYAVLLLIGCACTASAQSYWHNGDYTLKQRGYYGTPYGGGPEYGSGGGDQYGYGPATVMQNKHRIRYRRRAALGDGCGMGTTGFAPASERKSLPQSIALAVRRIG